MVWMLTGIPRTMFQRLDPHTGTRGKENEEVEPNSRSSGHCVILKGSTRPSSPPCLCFLAHHWSACSAIHFLCDGLLARCPSCYHGVTRTCTRTFRTLNKMTWPSRPMYAYVCTYPHIDTNTLMKINL